MENLELVSDVSGVTDYAYQGDRATTLTTGTVSTTLGYDFAGRTWSRASGGVEVEGFVHDVLDRLVQVRRGGVLTEFLEYSPTGEPLFRKLGTQGTWYVGSVATVTGTVPASCIDSASCVPVAGTVKVAAHVQVAGGRVATIKAASGTGLDPISDVLYYHRDMQGSVVATTYRSAGLSGSMGARYRYTPYGQLDRAENVSAQSDSELGYTGGLRLGYAAGAAQQGNLVLLGARVYHAELKRWLVPDRVDARRYTYAGGDPVNFRDPSGRMPVSAKGPTSFACWENNCWERYTFTGPGSQAYQAAQDQTNANAAAVNSAPPVELDGLDWVADGDGNTYTGPSLGNPMQVDPPLPPGSGEKASLVDVSSDWNWSDPSGPPDNSGRPPMLVNNKYVPGDAVLLIAPNGKSFWAPPWADYQEVYAAGVAGGMDPFAADNAIGHFGKFDYQRDSASWTFTGAYTNASNFAVGIYMNGAGVPLSLTLAIGSAWAGMMSRNAGSPAQREFWTQGWIAASRGVFP